MDLRVSFSKTHTLRIRANGKRCNVGGPNATKLDAVRKLQSYLRSTDASSVWTRQLDKHFGRRDVQSVHNIDIKTFCTLEPSQILQTIEAVVHPHGFPYVRKRPNNTYHARRTVGTRRYTSGADFPTAKEAYEALVRALPKNADEIDRLFLENDTLEAKKYPGTYRVGTRYYARVTVDGILRRLKGGYASRKGAYDALQSTQHRKIVEEGKANREKKRKASKQLQLDANQSKRTRDLSGKAHINDLEPRAIRWIDQSVSKDFIVVKSHIETSKVDIAVRPKSAEDENMFMSIQLKSVSDDAPGTKKNFYFRSKYAYDGIVVLCTYVDRSVAWWFDGATKFPTTIAVPTTTDRHDTHLNETNRVRDMKALFWRLWKDTQRFPHRTLDDIFVPTNKNCMGEQRTIDILRQHFPRSVTFVTSKNNTTVDLLIDNIRLQLKTTVKRQVRTAPFKIGMYKHMGTESGRRAVRVPYDADDFDILAVSLIEDNTFYGIFLIPMSELVRQRRVGLGGYETMSVLPPNDLAKHTFNIDITSPQITCRWTQSFFHKKISTVNLSTLRDLLKES